VSQFYTVRSVRNCTNRLQFDCVEEKFGRQSKKAKIVSFVESRPQKKLFWGARWEVYIVTPSPVLNFEDEQGRAPD